MAAGREARSTRVRLVTAPGQGGAKRMFFVIEGGAKRPGNGDGTPSNGEPVRWNRIRNARARAAAGFYDRPEVRAQVVDALLRELDKD